MTPRSLSFTLPEPPSANRWWRKWQNRMVLSAEARAYKELAALTVLRVVRRQRPFAGPVAVSIAWHRKRKAGDLDKRIGVVLDALQGVAYANDSQIVSLHATRHDAPANPRVEITITEAA